MNKLTSTETNKQEIIHLSEKEDNDEHNSNDQINIIDSLSSSNNNINLSSSENKFNNTYENNNINPLTEEEEEENYVPNSFIKKRERLNNQSTIMNIPEFISKVTSSENTTILNTDMILFIYEICLNSSQFNIRKDINNSSRLFWIEIGRIKLLNPITNIYKPETLRKYWRILRNAKNSKKILNMINIYKNKLNNENIKLLSCINIICNFVMNPKKNIDTLINKYCPNKIIEKTFCEKKMSNNDEISEIIETFIKEFPNYKKNEIIDILYKTSFDIKNSYLVLKDIENFGYLCFNQEEDLMILNNNIEGENFMEFAYQKGYLNIIKRKKFLIGKNN